MSDLIETTETTEEFHFSCEDVEYLVFDASWKKNGNSVYDVLRVRDDEFMGSILVAPNEDVEDVFVKWYFSLPID